MSHSFLVIGSMAWDRVIPIDGEVFPGGRVTGEICFDPDSDLPAGRLGGGAANAAAAWVNAGHNAYAYVPVSSDRDGDKIISAAAKIGIDTRYVQRIDLPSSTTLVLIDRKGERTILRLHPKGKSSTPIDTLRSQMNGFDPTSLPPFDGVYVRSVLPGVQSILQKTEKAHILAQWPFRQGEGHVDADTFVGSADDLMAKGIDPDDPWPVAVLQAGKRLRQVVITRGAKGGIVFTANGDFDYSSPQIDQVDATGAGD
ncbi:MAG: PfkB family carbohydrate kinase, partial [Pseudomonadota bacterium]